MPWRRLRSRAPQRPSSDVVEVAPAQGDQRGWGPIGVLSGLAERLGGAVSETIGIDVESTTSAVEGNGNGPERERERAREAEEQGR